MENRLTMLPSSGFELDEDNIFQLINEILTEDDNIEIEYRHTLQNTGMPHGTAHHTPNHVITNFEIGHTNIVYPNQIPENIAHEQHSHIFPNTFNDQFITSDKIHEDVAVLAPAMTANNINVSTNKVLQNHKNHEIASIEQLIPNQPQTSVELNSNVSEEDSMSMSAPTVSLLTSVKKYDTDIESIKKCECIPNCNNMCSNKMRYASTSKRQFMCPIKECKRLFASNNNLQRHIRSHTDEKPYVCIKCGQMFTYTTNLTRHNREQHVNSKIHTCKICFKKFARKDYLKRHKKLLHMKCK